MSRAFMFSLFLVFCTSLSGQVDFEETHLPLIVIDTEGQTIEDEPKILVRCGIVDNPSGINSVDDFPNVYNGFIGIEIRGQSSFFFPKKSYGIEFRDSEGEDLNVEVLGFPKEEDFVLHGPYSDKSLIRNAIVYSMSAEIMDYAPRSRFVEVVIDDQYKGLYLMVEKIKRDENRVDIEKLEVEDVEGEDVEGGYIVKFDKSDITQETLWYSPYKVEGLNIYPPFIVSYPKAEDIQPEQVDYIRTYVTEFEMALKAEDFSYEGKSYKEYINISSVIDYMLISEFTRNLDAYRVSTFMYKDKGGKLNLGPMWDFNLAMGNAEFCDGGESQGWQYNFNEVCPWDNWLNHFWWKRFLEDEEFLEQYKERYLELRTKQFNIYNLYQRIDSLVHEVGDAVDRNFQQYEILGTYQWPNLFVGETYSEEIQYLKQWFQERADFMDENLVNGSPGIDAERMPFIYPNPNQGEFSLALGLYTNQVRTVLIYGNQGQLVEELKVEDQAEIRFFEGLLPGIYYIRLVDSEAVTLGEILKLCIF